MLGFEVIVVCGEVGNHHFEGRLNIIMSWYF